MASTRLNKLNRGRIKRELLQNADKRAEIEAAVEERYRLAELIYIKAYGQDTVKKMYALPEGWLPVDNKFSIQWGNARRPVHLKDYKRMLTQNMHGRQAVNTTPFARDDQLVSLWEKQEHIKDELQQQERRIERDVETVIEGCRTTRQLIQVWPEIEHIVRKYEEPKRQVQLPAKPLPDLTRELGLPQVNATLEATAVQVTSTVEVKALQYQPGQQLRIAAPQQDQQSANVFAMPQTKTASGGN